MVQRTPLPERDENLRQFATPQQWEVMEALWRGLSGKDAALELGMDNAQLYRQRSAFLKKMGWRGVAPSAPNFDMGGEVPDGFVVKGQSALTDANGNLSKRWDKTRQAGMPPEEAMQLPDPKKVTKLSTMTDAEGAVIIQWKAESPTDVAREHAWAEYADGLCQKIERCEPTEPPKLTMDNFLAVYPIGDHHLGMYAWEDETGQNYDLKIGEELLTGAMGWLTKATPPASKALVVILGDLFHYDSLEPVTPTAKNNLDSDGRYGQMIGTGFRTIRRSVELALRRHNEVRIIAEPGNHDLSTMVFFALALDALYENEPRVTVDVAPRHFHYYEFGVNLIGVHHGHGVKLPDLPLVMASDMPEAWGRTTCRWWLTGHVHKDRTHDFQGVRVESFRILPPGDAWSMNSGYRAARRMVSVLLNKDYGEVGRNAVTPDMLRDSVADASS